MVDLQIASPTNREVPLWKVQGQIESDESIHPEIAFLRDPQDDRLVAEAVPDEVGCFTLRAGSGHYELVIGMGVRSIVVPHLQLE